ncbi:MAG: hypothetical protein A2000_03550 [Ignavibacteria bacterium GWB2_36_8]|nr:MAG: hypothetical protein A2000_03550 [Ignavibacteria bacterium GWB2_36_8]OGU53364.1 MAG: hypothetical protein A2080_04340 [Ignavibacteria bacterium GWC2_36_12]
MTSKIRSPREITRINIKYELRMINVGTDVKSEHLKEKKKKKISEKRDDFIGSIYTDSILLHVRNLYYFFYSKKGAKAKDFLLHKWMPTKFNKIDNKLIDDISIYRSHISKSRKMGDGKPKWERIIEKMRDEISKVYEEFREQLSHKELENWPEWETLTKIL